MNKQRFLQTLVALVLAFSCAHQAIAQDAPSQNSKAPLPTFAAQAYKVSFAVRSLSDGKLKATRNYTTLYAPTRHYGGRDSSIRVTEHLPFYLGKDTSSTYTGQTDFDFHEIEMPAADRETGKALFSVSIQTTDFKVHPMMNAPATEDQRALQTEGRSFTTVLLTFGKPSVILSSDQNATDDTTQVEMTVTPVH